MVPRPQTTQVGLMQEYNEPMPGLLYEAELPQPPRGGAGGASSGQQGARPSAATSAASSTRTSRDQSSSDETARSSPSVHSSLLRREASLTTMESMEAPAGDVVLGGLVAPPDGPAHHPLLDPRVAPRRSPQALEPTVSVGDQSDSPVRGTRLESRLLPTEMQDDEQAELEQGESAWREGRGSGR